MDDRVEAFDCSGCKDERTELLEMDVAVGLENFVAERGNDVTLMRVFYAETKSPKNRDLLAEGVESSCWATC